MTEAEWLTCNDPREMITRVCVWEFHTLSELGQSVGLLRQNKTERRYRLFACGCMRQVWHLLDNPQSRRAIELAEDYAEGKVQFRELAAARARLEETVPLGLGYRLARLLRIEAEGIWSPALGLGVTQHLARLAAYKSVAEATGLLGTGAFLPRIFRDIFGNPFRPVALSLAWRTTDAVAIARGMYDSRDFGAMPILADALQDAGCDNADVLSHCRTEGATHVRGCWVVDLVLGKE